MLSTPIIEVAIGMTFCFASVALMTSSLAEAFASLLKLRARTLFGGIKRLLNDDKFQNLALAVYNCALAHPYGDGRIASGSSFKDVGHAPAYIAARNFAVALSDALQAHGTILRPAADDGAHHAPLAGLEAAIRALPDAAMRALLLGMLARAGGQVERFEEELVRWFDAAMDRVSGTYKRYSQLITFLIALLLAISCNIDSIYLCRELWKDPQRQVVLSNIAAYDNQHPDNAHSLTDMAGAIRELPVGQPFAAGVGTPAWWSNVLGVLITASAAMFGAPFWFDMLQRLTRLRSDGPKPDDGKPRVTPEARSIRKTD